MTHDDIGGPTHLKEKIMNRSLITLFMPLLLSTPVFADNGLCQEEARAIGYENALETLPPCKPEKRAAVERDRAKESLPGREQSGSVQEQGLEAREQYGQIQIQ